jgi:hypothetical protein
MNRHDISRTIGKEIDLDVSTVTITVMMTTEELSSVIRMITIQIVEEAIGLVYHVTIKK